jgi:hypothetical protein
MIELRDEVEENDDFIDEEEDDRAIGADIKDNALIQSCRQFNAD